MTDTTPPLKAVRSADATVRWTIIGLLSLGMVIAYASRSNISVALAVPDFIKLFQLSDTDRGTLNSAFFWAYAALQIPAGWVVDRYGVRLPYAISFVFWCLASAVDALAIGALTASATRGLLAGYSADDDSEPARSEKERSLCGDPMYTLPRPNRRTTHS